MVLNLFEMRRIGASEEPAAPHAEVLEPVNFLQHHPLSGARELAVSGMSTVRAVKTISSILRPEKHLTVA